MPLPPAPTRRGARLSPEALAPVAVAGGRRGAAGTRKSAPPRDAPDAAPARTAVAATPPVARTAPNTPLPAKSPTASGPAKLFVLDSNVLLHDPVSLFRFQEHDVFLPLVVLEELDAHKKGVTEVARNARQVSRSLDALLQQHADVGRGLPLDGTGQRTARGLLHLQTATAPQAEPPALPPGLHESKGDNLILAAVCALHQQHQGSGRRVVLVSRDINMRVKARALGLAAEDYQNDRALEDGDLLYSGTLALEADFWAGQKVHSWQEGALTCYRLEGSLGKSLLANQFVYREGGEGDSSLHLRVSAVEGQAATLKTIKDFTHARHAVWGVGARNREQNFALNLLMDPDIDLVTLCGTAGTGKTLLALAAALAQVLDEQRYREIIMTRATVSVGEDIGFLPGSEEEKMGPWMGALDDNLEFLAQGGSAGAWGRAATNDLIRSKIRIKSMSFMRGRTFLNKYVIIDEAQNLTPKQIKTLITRAGPGSKVVCLGNLAQIDTPWLTEGSSGLTWVVDRFKGWKHSGHITLARGERSRLADFASEVL